MDDKAVRRCPTCGGPLNVKEDTEIVECEHCGNMIQISYEGDAKKEDRYKRADKQRLACEFDRAAGMYESIIADYPNEAEAYMYLVLCKYGIQYVDDPGTGKKIPTCHRSSYESILEDDDYKQAVKNASPIMRESYESMGTQLEELRKNVIKRSEREDPYDIFICYKETDEDGDRTIDSVTAHKLYEALTEKNYKVFYSHVTLEGKPGIEFEPYIYAALSSARIMFVFGSCPEYFNAVWVKNEWKRFLKLKEKDSSKIIIPCFIDMSANDIPSEINSINATKMNKITAIQDLVEAVMKIIPKKEAEKPYEHAAPLQNMSQSDTLTERGYNFLGVKDFDKASEYFNRALDMNAKSHRAYWGAFLSEYKCTSGDTFANLGVCPESNPNYQYACKYADNISKKEYEETTKRAYYICQNKITGSILAKDKKNALKMISQYDMFSAGTAFLSDCYKTLTSDYNPDNPQKHIAEMLLRLIDTYTKDSEYQNNGSECTKNVVRLYSDYMNETLSSALKCHNAMVKKQKKYRDSVKQKKILIGFMPEFANKKRSPDNLFPVEDEYATVSQKSLHIDENGYIDTPNPFVNLVDIWTDPASSDKTLAQYVNLDGMSGSVGDRMLYIAENVYSGYINRQWAEYIYSLCVNAAGKGADAGECDKIRAKFITELINGAESVEPLEYAASIAPDDWRTYGKFTEIVREHTPEAEIFDAKYVDDFDFDEFMKANYTEYKYLDKQERVLDFYIGLVKGYHEFADCRESDLKPWIDKVISLSNGNAGEFKNEWDKYMTELRAHCSEKEAFYSEKLVKVREKIDSINKMLAADAAEIERTHKKHVRKERIKGIFIMLSSCIPLIIAAVFAFFGYRHYKLPEKLMPYNDMIYIIIACAICVLLAIILYSILSKINKKSRDLVRLKKTARIVTFINRFLTPLLMIGAAVLFVMADIQFNKNTVYVLSKADDFTMFSKHPRINYVIESDIDYTDKTWDTIDIKGSLDGQGHIIKGVIVKDSYMFESVKGTLKNIKFQNVGTESTSFSIVDENKGKIENCILDGFVQKDTDAGKNDNSEKISEMNFSGFVKSNEGTISGCVVMNVNGNYKSFCGVADTNKDKGTIVNCMAVTRNINTTDSFAGFVNTNEGKIESCNSNILCYSEGTAAGIAKNSSGPISKSYVIGQIEASASAGGIVVTLDGNSVNQCYANVSIKNFQKNSMDHAVKGIGGIAANISGASISDSYSLGTIELLDVQTGAYADVGGLAGCCYDEDVKINNCYTNMKITKGECRFDIINAFVAVISYCDVYLDSCFSSSNWTSMPYNYAKTLHVENCYSTVDESKLSTITAENKFKVPSFIKGSLGWSDSIWNMVPAKFPSLKEIGANIETDVIG